MRKLILFAIATAVAAMPLPAQQPRDTTISVSITRAGRAAADRVSLFIGVEAFAETPSLAIERLQAKLKVIQDSVRRVSPSTTVDQPMLLGVAQANQTSYPPMPGPASVARATLRINVTKLADLPPLQIAASNGGATISGGASYESSLTENIWKTKIGEATESARGAAEVSAAAQGYKLGALLSLNIGGGPQIGGFQPPQLNFDSRQYTPVVAPEILVNATVNATYLLVRK